MANMFSQGIFLTLFLLMIDIQVRGQTNISDIPVEVTIPDSEKDFSGLVEIKCHFPLSSAQFSVLWWHLNGDPIFFQESGGVGSKFGNYGDIILDHGSKLTNTTGGRSEHHIIIDATLCYDRWKFLCQVISVDQAEGKGEATLKLKEPEISLNICDTNCTEMAPNTTHSISCFAKGTRTEPNITISVSGEVMNNHPMSIKKDENKCYYESEENVDVALDTDGYYDVTCTVQDGDKIYKVSKSIGEQNNSATSVMLHGCLAAILFARLLL